MASSQTSNYKHNSKIDAALKALASKDTALDSDKCGVTAGVYTGDGSMSRTITLGFRPAVILLLTEIGIMRVNDISYGGLAMAEHPLIIGDCTMIESTSTGFVLRRGALSNGNYSAEPNKNAMIYRYMAFH